MIHEGRHAKEDLDLTCDVCVVGSGAGGATAAAVLARAGYTVVVLEAGGSYRREHFTMQEAEVYPKLYQEGMQRATADLAIAILQGRAVGGGTVVNWTTCFRTPGPVLAHWQARYGLTELTEGELTPHWEAMEGRLGISEVRLEDVNANNRVLWDGLGALGWQRELLKRNVRGCARTGYCGMGCPVDAKQSAALTSLQDALAAGAQVFSDCDVRRLRFDGPRVVQVDAELRNPERAEGTTGRWVRVRPQICVLAGGALNSPALLLRSEAPDPHERIGRRTFLHPVAPTAGEYAHRIDPFYGIPQSVASHHFAHRTDGIGFFLEVAPLHPVLYAASISGHGPLHKEAMARLGHTAAVIALVIDGFDESEPGGTVTLHADGTPRLDYPIPERVWAGLRAGTEAALRVHLAAGARRAFTGHEPPLEVRGDADLGKLSRAPWEPNRVRLSSAHQMGGCAMGRDPAESVVDSDLCHHIVRNLYVMDGSVMPTSLGVNPQHTIYGLTHRAATRLARRGRAGKNAGTAPT